MSRRTRRAANPAVLPVARHARLRRATTLGVITRFVAGTLAVVLVSGAAVAGFAVWDVQNSLKPAVRLANDSASQAPGISAIEGGVNLLIVGSDTRDGQDEEFGSAEVDGGVLNDVTMLVHIADDHRSMSVVSFPRDMFVPIPSCPRSDGSGSFSAVSSQKINTTLSRGGLPCTVLTVEQLTGLTIPYAALIDFNGVVELSNAVGGVEVCVATPINDPLTNLTLEAGLQTLTGTEVTQFLRTRHGVGDGSDLGRISNQQLFLSALIRELQNANTLSSPTAAYGIAKAVVTNLQLSTSLSDTQTIAAIAMAVADIPQESITFLRYPVIAGDSGEQSGLLPVPDEAAELIAALSADRPISITGGTGVGAVGGGTQPTSTASPDVLELPATVPGQTANEVTCSAGTGSPR